MPKYEINLLGTDGRQYRDYIDAPSQADALRIANAMTQESGARVLSAFDPTTAIQHSGGVSNSSFAGQYGEEIGRTRNPQVRGGDTYSLELSPSINPNTFTPYQPATTTMNPFQQEAIQTQMPDFVDREEDAEIAQNLKEEKMSDINDKIIEKAIENNYTDLPSGDFDLPYQVLNKMVMDGDLDEGSAQYWLRNQDTTIQGQEMKKSLNPSSLGELKASEPQPAFAGWSKQLIKEQPSGNLNRTNGSGSNFRVYEYTKGNQSVRVWHLISPGEGNNFLNSSIEIPVTPNVFQEGKGWSDIEYDDFVMFNNRKPDDIAEKGIPYEQNLLYSELGDFLEEVTVDRGDGTNLNPYINQFLIANEQIDRPLDYESLKEANVFGHGVFPLSSNQKANSEQLENYINTLKADPETGFYLPSTKATDIETDIETQMEGFQEFDGAGTGIEPEVPAFVDPAGIGQETGMVPGFATGAGMFSQTDIDPRTQVPDLEKEFVEPKKEVVDAQPSANPGSLDELFNNFGIDTGPFGLNADSLPGFPIDLFEGQDLFVDVTEIEQIPNPSYKGVRGSGQPDENGNVEFYQITNTRRVENPAIKAALDAYSEQLRARTELEGSTAQIISQQIQSTRGMGVGADRLSPQELADLERNVSLIGASEGLLSAPGQFEQQLGDFRLQQLRESGRPQVQQTLAGIYSDPVAYGLATSTEAGRRFLENLERQAFQQNPFAQQQMQGAPVEPFDPETEPSSSIPIGRQIAVDQPFGGVFPVSNNQGNFADFISSNLSSSASPFDISPINGMNPQSQTISARDYSLAGPAERARALAEAAQRGVYGEEELVKEILGKTPASGAGTGILAPRQLKKSVSADPFSGAVLQR
tara:strand:- start:7749 stop:10349 length:2601 start_codon:yes stop_codon:yes gene_type:complete